MRLPVIVVATGIVVLTAGCGGGGSSRAPEPSAVSPDGSGEVWVTSDGSGEEKGSLNERFRRTGHFQETSCDFDWLRDELAKATGSLGAACYELVDDEPELPAGRVTWEIEFGDGVAVRSVELVTADRTLGDRFVGCVAGGVRTWAFPATRCVDVAIRYPMHFAATPPSPDAPARQGPVGPDDASGDGGGPVSADDEGPRPVLDEVSLREEARAQVGGVLSCYRAYLSRTPVDRASRESGRLPSGESIAGELQFGIGLGADGRVHRVDVLERTVGDAELERCAVAAVSGWSFGLPTGVQDVYLRYPVRLRLE